MDVAEAEVDKLLETSEIWASSRKALEENRICVEADIYFLKGAIIEARGGQMAEVLLAFSLQSTSPIVFRRG